MHEVLDGNIAGDRCYRGNAEMSEFADQVNLFLQQAQVYFGQLNEYEKYGWVAEGIGLLLVIVGIVLLF